MNTISYAESFKQKAVYETIIRLIGYKAKNSEDFMCFFLKEIVKQTGSRKGYIFQLTGKNLSFTLTEGITFDEKGELVNHNGGYKLIVDGEWAKALENDGIFVENHESKIFSRRFENARRMCSFPVTTDNSLKVVLVITDKDQDYDSGDIQYLELLKVPAGNIAENFRKQEELLIAKDKAEKNDQRKLSYLINISHEIKTPVNAIAGFSQLLKENDQSPENRKKFLDVILESSTDLVEIINNVAEISNVESGMIKIREKEVFLSDVFSELFEQFKDEAFKKKIVFKTDISISDKEGRILVDRGRLLQIFSALLSNSFKFTFTGRIVFGCKLRKDFIEFFVSDTGIGIPKEEKSKVFDHFFHAGNSISSSFKGTGLGLTITKAVTEQMGGEIWCDSEEGKGTDFHFTLPYKRTEMSSVSKVPLFQGAGVHLDRKRVILVAEDDNLNFTLITSYLSGLDIELLRAVNGKEAVDICSLKKVDLVLMDIKMPVMDGLIATRIIKEADPNQIIIAQTAYIDDREIAIACGCTDFIAKPFGKKLLISLINNYI